MKRNREQIISNPQRGDVIRHPTFVGGATRFNLLRPDAAIDAHAQGQAGEAKDG